MTAVLGRRPVIKKGFGKLDIAILIFGAILAICLVVPMFTVGVSATGNPPLTDLFTSKSFQGSAEALKNANVIGMVMHYVISWFSFLGLCLTLYQKFITLLYLSARTMFDKVYDVKINKMKGSALGYGELLKSLFVQTDNGGEGGGGGGLDVFITFVYSLLPNIKAYCDYNPDKISRVKNLTDEDGVTQYMLKTAIPTIMLIFFLTIGYSGTLAKMYGMVVDGMAAAADHLVEQNLGAWVKRTLGTTGTFDFQLNNSSKQGGFANQIALKMYQEILAEFNTLPKEQKDAIGRVIEASVFGNASDPNYVAPRDNNGGSTYKGVLGGKLGASGTNTETMNPNLESILSANAPAGAELFLGFDEAYDMDLIAPFINPQATYNVYAGTLNWNVGEIIAKAVPGSSVGMDRYIHVVIKPQLMRNTTNYLSPAQQGNPLGIQQLCTNPNHYSRAIKPCSPTAPCLETTLCTICGDKFLIDCPGH